jgi:YtxH-like protein
MRFKKREPFFSVLLDTGINLLDSLRERVPDKMDDIKDSVRDTYDTATRRVSRASDAIRGEVDPQILGKAVALLIGVGIGLGVGLLIAPASGEETRGEITDRVSDFSEKVRERNGKKPQDATGTHGE